MKPRISETATYTESQPLQIGAIASDLDREPNIINDEETNRSKLVLNKVRGDKTKGHIPRRR